MNETIDFVRVPENISSLIDLSDYILDPQKSDKKLAIAKQAQDQVFKKIAGLMSLALEQSGLDANEEDRDEFLLAQICVWILAYYKIAAKINEETMMAGGNQKTISRTWSRIFCLLGMKELMRDENISLLEKVLVESLNERRA